MHTDSDSSTLVSTDSRSRRGFLRQATLTGLAVAGLGSGAMETTAQTAEAVSTVRIESARWFGRLRAEGSLPVTDELLVFVHGFLQERTPAEEAAQVAQTVAAGGYDPDETVAIEWPTDVNLDTPTDFQDEETGAVVADLVATFYDNGGGAIRLVGHSIGTRCVFETLAALRGRDEIETVATFGATAAGSAVCTGPWTAAVENACQLRNYHAGNDETVRRGYGDDALGVAGAACDVGAGYSDRDVTESVDGHAGYLGDATVGTDLAEAIENGSCDGVSDGRPGGTGGRDASGYEDGGDWWRSGASGGTTGRADSGGRSNWW